jgi:hypothetical protein
LLLTLLDGRTVTMYFFPTKCNLPPSKVSVLLFDIRLTKPHFDSSSGNRKKILFVFSLLSLFCSYGSRRMRWAGHVARMGRRRV